MKYLLILCLCLVGCSEPRKPSEMTFLEKLEQAKDIHNLGPMEDLLGKPTNSFESKRKSAHEWIHDHDIFQTRLRVICDKHGKILKRVKLSRDEVGMDLETYLSTTSTR